MHLRTGLSLLGLAAAGMASAQFQISLGLRETAAGGGTDVGIGNNGGTSGGIEFVNRDLLALPIDGQWHEFSFELSSATYTAFAGTTANSVLDGAFGVLEHIRIRNIGGTTDPIQLWIDDVANTITPPGGSPTTFNFGSFEGYAPGTEVIFQEPRFSGSTSAFLMLTPNFSGVDDTVAFAGSNSLRTEFAFVNNVDTNWIRLTTFGALNLPNPMVRFDQDSVISFRLRAVPEPASMAALGLGVAALLSRRRKRS